MPHTACDNLSILRDLGTPSQMWDLARRRGPATNVPKVNAHIHLPPNFSAFASVQQAVDLAAQQGLVALGASNYYNFQVYADFLDRARQRGVFPLFGIEVICTLEDLRSAGVKINDPGNPGKMYLCGKGVTAFTDAEMTGAARQLLGIVRSSDADRMARMVARLAEVLALHGVAINLDAPAVIDRIVQRCHCDRAMVYLQERHVAQAFAEELLASCPAAERADRLAAVLGAPPRNQGPIDAVGVASAIRAHLLKAGKPAFVEESFIDFAQARALILELGGFPCYPVLADGAAPVCAFEDPVEQLRDWLCERGVPAVEFIPTRNQPALLGRYVLALRQAGLAVTAGTEHNTPDMIGLEPACVQGQPIPAEVRAVFWEGACVVAAHQFLSAHGQCGLVDRQGKPHGDYPDAHRRLMAFARLGAAVIARYQERCPGAHGTHVTEKP